MPVCLQGGAAFRPPYEQLDRATLGWAHGRRVVVAAYAAAPGEARDRLAATAAQWYIKLGATDVAVAVDEGHDGALLASASLIVLPGADPVRLLKALTPYAESLRSMVRFGGAIIGSDAGARVLCSYVALPDSGNVVPGLDVVDGALALPHWTDDQPSVLDELVDPVPPDVAVFGIPDRAALLLDRGQALAAGGRVVMVAGKRRTIEAGQSIRF